MLVKLGILDFELGMWEPVAQKDISCSFVTGSFIH